MCANYTIPECKLVYTGILLILGMFLDTLQQGFTDYSLYEHAKCRLTITCPSGIVTVHNLDEVAPDLDSMYRIHVDYISMLAKGLVKTTTLPARPLPVDDDTV